MRRLSGVPLIITCSVCLSLSIACHIIALSTRHWMETSSHDVDHHDNSAAAAASRGRRYLHVGLWQACFDNYQHVHELPARRYDGCHSLYSHYYDNLRDWLIPPWLSVCRVTAIISLVLQLVSLALFIVLVVCPFVNCLAAVVQDQLCQRVLLYATPITTILAGVLLMTTLAVFADNAFRQQCRQFWLSAAGSSESDVNRLSWSCAFEFVSCILTFLSAAFVVWLVVLKARDDI